MLDFNGANEQTDGGGSGPIIPSKSGVKLRITGLKQPSAQQRSNADPALIYTSNDKGESHGLVLLFEVVAGQFTGNTLSKWYTMQGGSDKARDFAFDAIRAILDAAKGLDFNDNSPQAQAARNMQNQGFGGFVGLEFPAEIKIKDIKPGDQYINNEIGNIIKVTDNRYQHIMAGGDVITETPIPQLPQGNQGGNQGGSYTPAGNNYGPPNQGGNQGNNYSQPNQGGGYQAQSQGQGNPNGGQGNNGQPQTTYQNPNQGNNYQQGNQGQANTQGNPNQGGNNTQGQPDQSNPNGGYQQPNNGGGTQGGGPGWANPNQGGNQQNANQQAPADDIPF